MMSRVVITGMGVISPLGNTVDALWQGLVSGQSGVKSLRDITHSDLFERLGARFNSQVIAEVEHFEELQQLPKQVALRDRYIQFAVAAALQAVHDARMDKASASIREHWGVVLTTAVGPAQTTEEVFCQATNDGKERFDPGDIPAEFFLDWMCNTPTTMLAQLLQINGPCDTISSACASGIDIIGYAYELIRDGEATVMLAGASEAPLAPTRFGACDIIHCLATDFNDEPQRASRPFDSMRSGFVLAEGAAAFLLEEREHAINRGAHIYAEITGFGLTSNATHMIS
ncbi:MAG TPA: beta-ketoacyl synthase N-terminal-like domain-containing protein, partial [Ktedonobacteraceae bacterium]|nr:beta-ketoacyl synthase N-terminal-like domain-containing protein [Ktedonobacteraceae bacterium]